MDKQVRKLCKELQNQGFVVERGGKHLKVFDDTESLIAILGTASDWRTMKNVVSNLRKAGVDLPRDKW